VKIALIAIIVLLVGIGVAMFAFKDKIF